MNDQERAALRTALENDPELQARFAAATTEDELLALARDVGIEIEVTETADVSDAELAAMSGGYTFPPTDWIYCDNPWTNAWCTLKC